MLHHYKYLQLTGDLCGICELFLRVQLFCENLLVNINDFYRRTENYSELFGLLSDNGVHDEDIQIILDAYENEPNLQKRTV